jgi:hypothetical protein
MEGLFLAGDWVASGAMLADGAIATAREASTRAMAFATARAALRESRQCEDDAPSGARCDARVRRHEAPSHPRAPGAHAARARAVRLVVEIVNDNPRVAPRVVLRGDLDSDGRLVRLYAVLASPKLAHVAA